MLHPPLNPTPSLTLPPAEHQTAAPLEKLTPPCYSPPPSPSEAVHFAREGADVAIVYLPDEEKVSGRGAFSRVASSPGIWDVTRAQVRAQPASAMRCWQLRSG